MIRMNSKLLLIAYQYVVCHIKTSREEQRSGEDTRTGSCFVIIVINDYPEAGLNM